MGHPVHKNSTFNFWSNSAVPNFGEPNIPVVPTALITKIGFHVLRFTYAEHFKKPHLHHYQRHWEKLRHFFSKKWSHSHKNKENLLEIIRAYRNLIHIFNTDKVIIHKSCGEVNQFVQCTLSTFGLAIQNYILQQHVCLFH